MDFSSLVILFKDFFERVFVSFYVLIKQLYRLFDRLLLLLSLPNLDCSDSILIFLIIDFVDGEIRRLEELRDL